MAEPRRYVVVVQAPEGYPAQLPFDGPAPTPPHPVIHSAVLADDYEALEAQRDRLIEALEQIRDREWIDNALDPQWAAGVAREALERS